jgi:aspartate aminotransferase
MARVKPSPTGATLALASRLRSEGRDILSLGAGEPDFDTPQHIKDAAIAAIDRGDTKYTPIEGTAELKTAIQRKFRRENSLDYQPAQILVSAGGKQSLFNLCLALLNKGDEAIIPAPYWVSYPDMVRVADAEPVIIDSGIDAAFRISPEQLAAAITPRTRLVFLNSPSNPTGACYSATEFAALGEVLGAYPNIVIASDEMYEHIHWAPAPFVSFASACPALYPRTVTCNGVSKAYAMTGWRIGYAGGPAELIRAMATIQSQSTSNPCSISQAAAVAALDGPQDCVRMMCAAYRERHEYIVRALNSLPGIRCHPGGGAFYVFPHVADAVTRLGLEDDVALCDYLIREADLACVPGSAFGAPGYIRISYACALETLADAVRRLERALVA